MSDYYQILGVSREATPEEIKKAYRKKARQLHPDYAGPESEEAFKELSVAYETLSDQKKRQMYDLGGPDAVHGGSNPMSGAAGFGFADIFEQVFNGAFGGGASGPASRASRGRDQLRAIEVTLEEETFGAKKDITVDTWVTCARCQGACCEPGTTVTTCSTCSGSGFVTRVQRSLLGNVRTQQACSQCGGYGTIIKDPCHDCSGQGRVRSQQTLTVDIPAGVENGTRIRLSGRGEAGPAGGPHGDLFLEVHEVKHPVFARRGDDVHTHITVPMTVAALGTVFTLDTLDGSKEVTIEPGTQPEDEVVLKGLGVGHLQRSGRGDLHVHIGVEVPRHLDERSRTLLEELADIRGEHRVEVPTSQKSTFQRFRDKLTGQ